VIRACALALLVLLLLAAIPAAAQAPGGPAARGLALFMAHGCHGCHTIGAVGTPLAPDLSRIGARRTEAELARWLRDPAAQKPTAHMPRLDLSEADVAALAAYLASLGGSR
jgi:cytochrome c oxidase subunit 2